MAVILGKYAENKQVAINEAQSRHERKLNTLYGLIKQADEAVNKWRDLYDTFVYLEKNDNSFSDKVWKYIQSEDNTRIVDVDSYFGVQVNLYRYRQRSSIVRISRYGVSYNMQFNDKVIGGIISVYNYNSDDEIKNNFRKGKPLLKDYLENTDVSDLFLDYCTEDLEYLIDKLGGFVDKILNKISNYDL